jgi:hypothetical protein
MYASNFWGFIKGNAFWDTLRAPICVFFKGHILGNIESMCIAYIYDLAPDLLQIKLSSLTVYA